ncbi:MAG: PD40 domain-containing protein, partial [Bacteroidetes bacterium]|nr:PD40 domain-containing protein [Bacteroidota bacterium]
SSILVDIGTQSTHSIGLPNSYASIAEPTVTRDERSLAYCMGYPLMNSLYVTTPSRPSGGDVIVQGNFDTQTGLYYNVMAPTWSQDGSLLAFVLGVFNLNTFEVRGDVFVVNRNGTGLRRVTELPGNKIADSPSFSLDDQNIAFTVYTSSKSSFTTDELLMARRDIAVVPSAGGTIGYLTQDGTCSHPCFAGNISTSVELSPPQPKDISVNVFPHPVVAHSQVTISVPVEGRYSIALYDVMGRVVRRIYNGEVTGGMLRFELSQRDLAPGVYSLQVTGGETATAKLLTVIR